MDRATRCCLLLSFPVVRFLFSVFTFGCLVSRLMAVNSPYYTGGLVFKKKKRLYNIVYYAKKKRLYHMVCWGSSIKQEKMISYGLF